jgi:hypothetical protein
MNIPKPERISWQTHEHHHIEKSTDWFWTVGIIAAGGVFLSIFFRNLLFALIIVLFTATSFMLVKRKPRIMNFEISRKGIRVGPVLYPYSLFESFWVDDGEFDDKIILRSRKPLSPFMIIPFESEHTDPELLRDYLLDYLDEEELEEPLYQVIMEWFGF